MKTWGIRIFVFGATLIAAVNTCRSSDAGDSQDLLSRLLDQYRLVQTVHVKTTTLTDYKTVPPGIFHVEGTQEYWADGSKFRILQLLPSSVFPGMSHDVRWDGEHYQWFNVTDSTLIVSAKSQQRTPYLGEPIILLPVEFLNPGGDDLGVKLSLDDLHSDEIRSHLREARITHSDPVELTIPGDRVGGFDIKYLLDYGGSPSYLPTTIHRISSGGVELDTDEIRYRPVHSGSADVYLPEWVQMTDRSTDNRVDSITTCTVTLIEVGVTIPPETFTIDYQTAKRVIDIDHPTQTISGRPNVAGGLGAAGTASLDTKTDSNVDVVASDTTVAPSQPMDSDKGPWTRNSLCTMLLGLGLLAAGAIFMYRTQRTTKGHP
jgi:hypothetical protein